MAAPRYTLQTHRRKTSPSPPLVTISHKAQDRGAGRFDAHTRARAHTHTPVREDSSAAVRPSRITPSTGNRSLGRTSTVSPASAPANRRLAWGFFSKRRDVGDFGVAGLGFLLPFALRGPGSELRSAWNGVAYSRQTLRVRKTSKRHAFFLTRYVGFGRRDSRARFGKRKMVNPS